MSSDGPAAPHAAAPTDADPWSFSLSARAQASRANGARSRGPRSAEGKARAARNAVKHGLRARQHVVLHDEDSDELRILEQALVGELAPDGVLQSLLAQQLAHAAWRLRRANRIEGDLFAEGARLDRHGFLRSAASILINDCHGPRAFDTLLRYRGTTLAEFWRTLRMLKALQAEAAEAGSGGERVPQPAPMPVLEFKRARAAMSQGLAAGPSLDRTAPSEPDVREKPNKPERRGNPADSVPATPTFEPERPAIAAPAAHLGVGGLERRGHPQGLGAESDDRDDARDPRSRASAAHQPALRPIPSLRAAGADLSLSDTRARAGNSTKGRQRSSLARAP